MERFWTRIVRWSLESIYAPKLAEEEVELRGLGSVTTSTELLLAEARLKPKWSGSKVPNLHTELCCFFTLPWLGSERPQQEMITPHMAVNKVGGRGGRRQGGKAHTSSHT